MPNPLNTTDIPNVTKKGINLMPIAIVSGKKKHFPYTKKGKAAARKAREATMNIGANPMRKRAKNYTED